MGLSAHASKIRRAKEQPQSAKKSHFSLMPKKDAGRDPLLKQKHEYKIYISICLSFPLITDYGSWV